MRIDMGKWYDLPINCEYFDIPIDGGQVLIRTYDIPMIVLKVPCIYRIYLGRSLFYIGKTVTGIRRVIKQIEAYGGNRATILAFPKISDSDLDYLENLFIGFLNPPKNVANYFIKNKGLDREWCKRSLISILKKHNESYFRISLSNFGWINCRIWGPKLAEQKFREAFDTARREIDNLGKQIKSLRDDIANLERQKAVLTDFVCRKRIVQMTHDIYQKALNNSPLNWYVFDGDDYMQRKYGLDLIA